MKSSRKTTNTLTNDISKKGWWKKIQTILFNCCSFENSTSAECPFPTIQPLTPCSAVQQRMTIEKQKKKFTLVRKFSSFFIIFLAFSFEMGAMACCVVGGWKNKFPSERESEKKKKKCFQVVWLINKQEQLNLDKVLWHTQWGGWKKNVKPRVEPFCVRICTYLLTCAWFTFTDNEIECQFINFFPSPVWNRNKINANTQKMNKKVFNIFFLFLFLTQWDVCWLRLLLLPYSPLSLLTNLTTHALFLSHIPPTRSSFFQRQILEHFFIFNQLCTHHIVVVIIILWYLQRHEGKCVFFFVFFSFLLFLCHRIKNHVESSECGEKGEEKEEEEEIVTKKMGGRRSEVGDEGLIEI